MPKLRESFTFEEIDEIMKKYDYYASQELQYSAFLGLLNFSNGHTNDGQDIFAVCLEGPPGAGKTEYAKTYTKLVKELWDGEVELVDYQCDATTGKTELFEDINISAVIRGDADNVNIPGKLIEAIKKVNDGKKIILFIDEYDKAREETDAFLLQFLQSGKINSTQHGDLEIKPEYKSNLQLILCKNDTRDSLSGPLSRRIRIIRLDYMLPSTFYTVAKRKLIEKRKAHRKVDEGILNLVSLMYSNAYDVKEIFTRLPSCSEMLIAIQEADNLIKYANAPKQIVYRTIIENMFKEKDDIKTFEANTSNQKKGSKDKADLKALVDEMTKTVSGEEQQESLTTLIAKTVFKDEQKKMRDAIKNAEAKATQKISEAKAFMEEYEQRFAALEQNRQATIEAELRRINVGSDTFISDKSMPEVLSNFNDETAYLKRGIDIFSTSKEEWVQVATAVYPKVLEQVLLEQFKDWAGEVDGNSNDIVVYENGFEIKREKDFKLIMVREKSTQDENNVRLLFYANSFAVPLSAIDSILTNYIIMENTLISPDFTPITEDTIAIDCLTYSNKPLDQISEFKKAVAENIYSFSYESNNKCNCESLLNSINKLPQTPAIDIDHIMDVSKQLVKSNGQG